jgi:hypothetical protein
MKKSTSAKGFVNSLVVNGQTLEQKAKQIVTTINGQEVSLNCTYIADIELDEAYTSNFSVTHQDKVIEVHYTKVGNRVSASIYINDKLAFSSISVQAVFTVLNAAYGISKSSLNNLYVKSNGTRKQESKSVSKVTVESNFEF